MSTPVHVQIVTVSEERRRLWSDLLEAAGIVTGRQTGGTHEGLLDIVLTDLLPNSVAAGEEPNLAWQNGVVQIAPSADYSTGRIDPSAALEVEAEGPPRVQLPADAAPREIVLACRLLAQLVRLRRVERDAGERAARWKQLADADPLTGLMNRRAFSERIVEFLRAAGSSQHCCLALFDLDRFKPINDERGHSAGDQVLQHVASRLASSVRKGDLVCRLGGDEFAVALFGASPEVAGGLVERLRQSIAARDPQVSSSAGWAMLSTQTQASESRTNLLPDSAVDALYHHAFETADANLRMAKTAGRDRTIPS